VNLSQENFMKSALEIAMEKTASAQEGGSLTDEQKAAIAQLEKECQAKIAEQEIMVESKIKGLAAQEAGPEFSEAVHIMRQQLAEERARFEAEKARKVQAVRDKK
jgi:hypothetical protein